MKLIAVISVIALASAASLEAEQEQKKSVGVNTEAVNASATATVTTVATGGNVATGNNVVSTGPATNTPSTPTNAPTTQTPPNLQSQLQDIILFPLKFGVLFLALIGFLTLQRNGQNWSGALGRASSSASFDIVQRSEYRFSDVLGCDEIRQELLQILDVMKNPERYKRFGAKTPKGVLLKGPPGTGKTLIAKALAGESQIPLISTSGSAFEEALVGVGAARVRDLFSTARNKFNQSIIFIDEIDGIAGKRSADSKNTLTLNQLLVEMDGFNPSQIFVLAATNAYKDLDPAILRPGRFDQVLQLNLPDAKGRAQILAHNLRDVQRLLAYTVNVTKLAAETIGFSGAELAQLVNQAKLLAASSNALFMEGHHFDQALRHTRFGPKRAVLMSKRDKERIALHEAGHALVALLTPGAMPVQSATIIPHASALGMVVSVPGEADAYFSSLEAYLARIDVSLAGWLAEELAFNREQVSTGALSDLQKANAIARHMVDAGFGAKTDFSQPLLNPSPHLSSERARREYEEDVAGILKASKERVRLLLREREGAWRRIAEGLVQYETLSGTQMLMIIDTYDGEGEESE